MLFESMTPVNICIVLIAPEDPERDVMVNITTIADTAEGINMVLHICDVFIIPGLSCSTEGADFNQLSTQLLLNANSLLQCVNIDIVNDTILEENELFLAVLETDDQQVILDPLSANVIILNNDGKINTT